MTLSFKWNEITEKSEFNPEFHGAYVPDFDFYSMVDAQSGATDKEVKKSFRKKTLKIHPDKGGSKSQFQFMTGFFHWFLENRSTYDECRSKHLRLNNLSPPTPPAPPAPPIRKFVQGRLQEVDESGKAAFNEKKKQLFMKRKYGEPEDMDWEVSLERPVKKRRVTQQPFPPPSNPGFSHGSGGFSNGSGFVSKKSKKKRLASRRAREIFGFKENGDPCQTCISKGDYCGKHEDQRPTIAHPPVRNYGFTRNNDPCPNCLLAGDFCNQHDPGRASATNNWWSPFQGGIPGTSTGANGQQNPCPPGPQPGPHFYGQGFPSAHQNATYVNYNVQNVQNMYNGSSTHNGNTNNNQFYSR